MTKAVRQRKVSERGASLLEVLAAMVLLSLVAMGTAKNTIYALQMNKLTAVSNTVHNIAMSKIEEFAGADVSQLDDGDDLTESSVAVSGSKLTYTRISDVTVNANESRTVTVSVSCNDPRYKSTVTYTATYALWE